MQLILHISLLNYVITYARDMAPTTASLSNSTLLANSTLFNSTLAALGNTTTANSTLANVTGINTTALNSTATEDAAPGFEPSLVNTLVYLLALAMQASTVAVCYKGAPFMHGLFSNKRLLFM